jgi:hypothetical protein
VAFYEGDKYLASASKYYRVYFPSADVTVNLDKNAYAKGETIAINSIVRNKLSTGWQSILRISVWDSKGLIFEDSKTLLLPASGTRSVTTSYTLPTTAVVP